MKTLALILVLFSSTVFAGTKIAVVNMKEIMGKSTAVASINRQIVIKQKPINKEFEKKNAAILKESQKLTKQQKILSKEAFMQKVKAFRKKTSKAEKEMNAKLKKLKQGVQKSFLEVNRSISQIVRNISQSKNIDLVFPKDTTMYANEKLEITDEVIELLNKNLPDLTLEIAK